MTYNNLDELVGAVEKAASTLYEPHRCGTTASPASYIRLRLPRIASSCLNVRSTPSTLQRSSQPLERESAATPIAIPQLIADGKRGCFHQQLPGSIIHLD